MVNERARLAATRVAMGRPMTPNEQDNPETSVERETTEFYPFSSGRFPASREAPGQRQDWMPDWQQPEGPAVEETAPDVPVMEQLPDISALPDPGYPEMPTTTPPPVRLSPQLFPSLPTPLQPEFPLRQASPPEPTPPEPTPPE